MFPFVFSFRAGWAGILMRQDWFTTNEIHKWRSVAQTYWEKLVFVYSLVFRKHFPSRFNAASEAYVQSWFNPI